LDEDKKNNRIVKRAVSDRVSRRITINGGPQTACLTMEFERSGKTVSDRGGRRLDFGYWILDSVILIILSILFEFPGRFQQAGRARRITLYLKFEIRNLKFLRSKIMCLAVPGKVTEVYEAQGTRMGKVDFDGITKEICLAYLPDIVPGDYAIVHVGFAISKIDEASALETLRIFREMGVLEEELGAEEKKREKYSFETSDELGS
jgi:hydrogenase expression/formation protein HypC